MMKQAAIYTTLFVLLLSCTSSQYISGRDYYDISDNLDLEAVAYLFGESENLRDFEYRLNDPQIQISNLDLNRDGYIDYLRVTDASRRGIYLVVIQAVLGRNIFQDVATVSVGRDRWGRQIVEIVGDEYIYGRNYILIPEYAHQPVIFGFFRSPRYEPWHSPYYWDYYPSYYVYRRPRPIPRYHEYIHRHHYVPHTSHYSDSRRIDMPDYERHNDYGSRRPDHSFINRNQGVQNKQDLNRRRSESPNVTSRPSNSRRSVDPVQHPQTVPSSGRSDSRSEHESAPPRREYTRPSGGNLDSKPRQEQRISPANSGSGRRSGNRNDSSSDPKTNTTITKGKNTASPSVRKESGSRRQTTSNPAKESRKETKSSSGQTKSGSGRR
jgi:hypothetical protein